MTSARRHRSITLVIGALLALGSCGADDDGHSDDGPSITSPGPTTGGPVSTSPADPPGVTETLEGFEYYRACADVPIHVNGTAYYPVLPDEVASLEASHDQAGPEGVMRVAPPGPGDDVGTLVIYDDGIARYESESGVVTWFVDEHRTYNWDC